MEEKREQRENGGLPFRPQAGAAILRRLRSRWTGRAGIILLLLCAGWLLLLWDGKREPSPQVLQESVFSEVIPYLYEQDRLYFKGRRTGGGEHVYVFDLEKGRLSKEDWTRLYGDNRRTYPLGKDRRLSVEVRQGERRIVIEDGSDRREAAGSLPAVKQPLSVSPRGEAFIYTGKGERGLDLFLYRLKSKRSHPLKRGLTKGEAEKTRIDWSHDGRFLLRDGRHVHRTQDGGMIRTLAGGSGVWSAQAHVLVYIASDGKEVRRWDADSGVERTLHRAAEANERILRQAVWDPTGRYLAFPTGRRESGETYVEKIHVSDGRLYHYTEGEQNLHPTRLENLRLSEGGEYLSYAVNGILKLINLHTQESRAYDVIPQEEKDWSEYIRYDPDGVWLGQAHEILFVGDDMEETVMYRTPAQLSGYYLSSRRDKLLVMEETNKGTKLRLVDLPGESGSPTARQQPD